MVGARYGARVVLVVWKEFLASTSRRVGMMARFDALSLIRQTTRASLFRHRVARKLAGGFLCALLLWLLVWLDVPRRWRTEPAVCLEAPSSWTDLSGSVVRRGAPVRAGPTFILLWSTNASSFDHRAKKVIESIVHQHPNASVRVFSNELPKSFFGGMRRAGHAVGVERYDIAALLRGTPAERWLERLDEWRRGDYFYSHLTDVLRLALLYREGGVYLDTDVILTRPLPLPAPAAAAVSGSSGDSLGRRMANTLGIESFTDGDPTLPVLNGAVMVFERPGSRFLWNCLHEFSNTYNPKLWGHNGPELLTRVHRRCAASPGGLVQLQPPVAFYPFGWEDVRSYASAADRPRQERMWRRIERGAYAAHLWNRKTAGLRLEPGSVLHRLVHE